MSKTAAAPKRSIAGFAPEPPSPATSAIWSGPTSISRNFSRTGRGDLGGASPIVRTDATRCHCHESGNAAGTLPRLWIPRNDAFDDRAAATREFAADGDFYFHKSESLLEHSFGWPERTASL